MIVFTSNGERAFSAPFLRRCVRFAMPPFSAADVTDIVMAHLRKDLGSREKEVIADFARKLQADKQLAINQILEYVYIVTRLPQAGRRYQRDAEEKPCSGS